jgi:hypothetical protein
LDWEEEGLHVNPKDVHKFVDAYEVELVARCCRWGTERLAEFATWL